MLTGCSGSWSTSAQPQLKRAPRGIYTKYNEACVFQMRSELQHNRLRFTRVAIWYYMFKKKSENTELFQDLRSNTECSHFHF